MLVTTRVPGLPGKGYFGFMLRHVFFMRLSYVPVHRTHPPSLLTAQISKSLSATTKPARLPAPVFACVSTPFVFTASLRWWPLSLC